MMAEYDIAVIGAGAAGAMAAIRAGQRGRKVALIERNDAIGKKILLTGKGRCNITNSAPLAVFIEKFGERGEFFRNAFSAFSNEDLMDFFKSSGLELKVERQGRVFPASDKAGSVIACLAECLVKNNVETLYNMRLEGLLSTDAVDQRSGFILKFKDKPDIRAAKVILATGGKSYKITGSTGDGFEIAEKLGHTILPLKPGLVPLKTKDPWIKDLQAVALEKIRITFSAGRKKIVSGIGELMFTHFGVSGPLVLDLSYKALEMLEGKEEICLSIDLKPALTESQLEDRIVKDIAKKGNMSMGNFMKDYLPKRMIEVFLGLACVKHDQKTNQLTQVQRRAMIKLFKAFPLTITGSLAIEEAMVTGGGVSTKEIDPRTMESRRIKGLYFAGEIIAGAAASGGYNLQQAFSTGYLAGEKASCAN